MKPVDLGTKMVGQQHAKSEQLQQLKTFLQQEETLDSQLKLEGFQQPCAAKFKDHFKQEPAVSLSLRRHTKHTREREISKTWGEACKFSFTFDSNFPPVSKFSTEAYLPSMLFEPDLCGFSPRTHDPNINHPISSFKHKIK